jgi:hypothetical protein
MFRIGNFWKKRRKKNDEVDDVGDDSNTNRSARKVFRLGRLIEKTKLIIAKANKYKWIAVIIGLLIVAYFVVVYL